VNRGTRMERAVHANDLATRLERSDAEQSQPRADAGSTGYISPTLSANRAVSSKSANVNGGRKNSRTHAANLRRLAWAYDKRIRKSRPKKQEGQAKPTCDECHVVSNADVFEHGFASGRVRTKELEQAGFARAGSGWLRRCEQCDSGAPDISALLDREWSPKTARTVEQWKCQECALIYFSRLAADRCCVANDVEPAVEQTAEVERAV